MRISGVILTKNEENNIGRCLKSLDFLDEVVIIDDYSIDKTIEIAKYLLKNKDYKVFQRNLKGDFANQRNYGLGKASGDWIFFIDADEEVTKELKIEIKNIADSTNKNVNAYYIKRRDYFWNQELKYGEVKEVRKVGLIRLVKKNTGKWLGNVHEIFFTNKKIGYLKNPLNHFPHPNLKEFINKINYYSTLRAKELSSQGKMTNVFEIIIFPFAKFINNYFIKLGFLDGPPGFVYAFLMSFHSFLVRAKLFQLTKNN